MVSLRFACFGQLRNGRLAALPLATLPCSVRLRLAASPTGRARLRRPIDVSHLRVHMVKSKFIYQSRTTRFGVALLRWSQRDSNLRSHRCERCALPYTPDLQTWIFYLLFSKAFSICIPSLSIPPMIGKKAGYRIGMIAERNIITLYVRIKSHVGP